MGLTLIRKSRGLRPKRHPRIALVLAGGAVTGGAFKVGGLKALDDFLVGRKVSDLDMYVGLSAGSVLAVPLACGITPDEMVRVLEGTSDRLDQLRPLDFYHPNWSEFASRPARYAYDVMTYLPRIGADFANGMPGLPQAVGPALRELLQERSYAHLEQAILRVVEHVSPKREIPLPSNHLPSGFFTNARLERWLRRNLERIGIPNDFRELSRLRGRALYIGACELDSARRVVFGPDEENGVTVSQAVQASTALPIFYRPARLNGIDYVDGGVRNTANIDVAIEKGADLVICYNPFRPFSNRVNGEDAPPSYLADRGLKIVVNQVFRTLLHSRLRIALQRYLKDDRFQGDIVLLEPQEFDSRFFALNPLAFWKRAEALQHGFDSVRATIEENFDDLAEVMGRYGLRMNRNAARRRAAALRAARGWRVQGPPGEFEEERPALRLMRSEPA